MKLIVGLGNPGIEYAETRHNIGFMVATRVADRSGIALKRKGYQGFYGVGRVAGEEVTILLPQTYMNRSGASVAPAYQSLDIAPGDLIVIHDEIDLAFGCLRIKLGGGHGGHNGLRSTDEMISKEYILVRMGIGKPADKARVVKYVLEPFSKEEQTHLESWIKHTADAVEMLLKSSWEDVASKYSIKKFQLQ